MLSLCLANIVSLVSGIILGVKEPETLPIPQALLCWCVFKFLASRSTYQCTVPANCVLLTNTTTNAFYQDPHILLAVDIPTSESTNLPEHCVGIKPTTSKQHGDYLMIPLRQGAMIRLRSPNGGDYFLEVECSVEDSWALQYRNLSWIYWSREWGSIYQRFKIKNQDKKSR